VTYKERFVETEGASAHKSDCVIVVIKSSSLAVGKRYEFTVIALEDATPVRSSHNFKRGQSLIHRSNGYEKIFRCLNVLLLLLLHATAIEKALLLLLLLKRTTLDKVCVTLLAKINAVFMAGVIATSLKPLLLNTLALYLITILARPIKRLLR